MREKKPFKFLTSGFGLTTTHCLTHVNILDLSVTFRSVKIFMLPTSNFFLASQLKKFDSKGNKLNSQDRS